VDRTQLVPGREVLERISEVFPVQAVGDTGPAPAERFRFVDGSGEIGLISSVSEPFCGTCNVCADRRRIDPQLPLL